METSNCITEGLYLGGILAALNENDLSSKGITHILSVDESPLPGQLTKHYVYKHVQALDVEECDLLSSFPETFVFIEQARSAGGHVLVHCQAGMSRSATVLCAYLMQKMAIGKGKALELMVASRPSVSPNAGFDEQLDLFEAMGCQVIKTHPLYRSLHLRKLADRFQGGHYATGSQDLEVLSGLLLETDFSSGGNDAYYKCRKCRFILFRHGAVTSHAVGKGEIAFGWRGADPTKHIQGPAGEQQESCQRSLFVDPLMWMKGKINETCGKLHCPKCDIKIGSYVWYGEKCPCGSWVAPAFHIDTGKVDKIPFQTVAPSSRMPRGATNIVAPSLRGAAGAGASAAEAQSPHISSSPSSSSSPSTAAANISDRSWSSQSMGPSHSFPPSTSGCRGLSAKSNTAIVAAVAPLVSTTSSPSSSSSTAGTGSEGIGVRGGGAEAESLRSMDVQGGGIGGGRDHSGIPSSSFPASTSSSSQRQRVVGQAVPFVSNPGSGSGVRGDGDNSNVLMDVDS